METLTVQDGETGKVITIPIDTDNGLVSARLFEQLRIIPETNYAETVPLRIYDPGYKNTTVCKTKISKIDGVTGKLYYRGYDIEELVEYSSFLEVSYLLIYGSLPKKEEFDRWNYSVMHHTYIHTEMEKQMTTFRYNAHPMGMTIATIASLSTFHPEANPALQGGDLFMLPKIADGAIPTPEEEAKIKKVWATRNRHIYRMLGKVPTIAASTYRHRIGRIYNHPMPNPESYCENFWYMMDRLDELDYKPDPRLVKIFDKLFIVLAEHGSNNSTVTMRHLNSSGVDPYTALSGSMAALFGERKTHSVIEMLKQIDKLENIPLFLELVKNKKTDASSLAGSSVKKGASSKPLRLMGFGHRIYKTHDPRVKIVKRLALEVIELTGKDTMADLAIALEEAALADEYFSSRKLYPNVDYWTAIIFNSLKFPPDMFPVLLSIPRVAGFMAHWVESLDDPEYKIFRPRQIYIGETDLKYSDNSKRDSVDKKVNLQSETITSNPTAAKRVQSGVEMARKNSRN